MPALAMFFITYKYSPKSLETCLRAKLIRNCNIAITAPDMKMRKVQFPPISKGFERSNIIRKVL